MLPILTIKRKYYEANGQSVYHTLVRLETIFET